MRRRRPRLRHVRPCAHECWVDWRIVAKTVGNIDVKISSGSVMPCIVDGQKWTDEWEGVGRGETRRSRAGRGGAYGIRVAIRGRRILTWYCFAFVKIGHEQREVPKLSTVLAQDHFYSDLCCLPSTCQTQASSMEMTVWQRHVEGSCVKQVDDNWRCQLLNGCVGTIVRMRLCVYAWKLPPTA